MGAPVCPDSLLGYHVFASAPRGQRPRCRCGLTQPRVSPDSWHVLANCPCKGDEANCAWWNALNERRWRAWRVGQAELRYQDAMVRYAEALLAVEQAEGALNSERPPDHVPQIPEAEPRDRSRHPGHAPR